MSSDDLEDSPIRTHLEELDTEFYCNINEAKKITASFKSPKDRLTAARLIDRVLRLNSKSLDVKAHRNEFTKYFLKVLIATKETEPPQYDQWFKSKEDVKVPEETSLWSPDGRTFVATKTIPGFGMLVYMAVSNEPELGWQDKGFLSYEF